MKQLPIFLIGLLIGSFIAGLITTRCSEPVTISTLPPVRDTIYDTIRYSVPVPKDSVVLRFIDSKLPVSDVIKDSTMVTSGDSIPVQVPIVQREYKTEDYDAWVSGPINPQLDSINIFRKTHYETIYQTVSVPQKTKRWGLGVQVGMGITPTKPTKVEPYIGIGVSYNFLSW